jgi:FemAB-related protein (PEP-CTERM system-associated)
MITLAVVNDAKRWDDYVDAHINGSFCHLWGWRNIIVNTIGHTSHYLISTGANGSVNGLLPLVEMKSKLFGHTLTSTPFCMYGGALADSLEVQQELELEAIRIGKLLNVDWVELRYQTEQRHLTELAFTEKSVHSYFEKQIAEDDEAILAAIKKKQRAVVRHSLKNGLQVDIGQDVDLLYEIYATSVRNLGTPVFSKSLFSALVDEFKDKVDILTVKKEDKALSSVMSFYYKDMVMPYYGGGLAEARAAKSNDNMYYALMCHASKKGKSVFDFGRSKNDSGAFKYKRTWGIEPAPLFHYYYLVNASELPNLSPNNPKYQKMISIWQRLPLWLSKLVGPYLSKYLG